MEMTETFGDKDTDTTDFNGQICGPIAASMNEAMFQLVISKWRHAFDGLKESKDYKSLSAAGSLMKNMVMCTPIFTGMCSHALFSLWLYMSMIGTYQFENFLISLYMCPHVT